MNISTDAKYVLRIANSKLELEKFILTKYFLYDDYRIGFLNDHDLLILFQYFLGTKDYRYNVHQIDEGSFYEIKPINLKKHDKYIEDIIHDANTIKMCVYYDWIMDDIST